MPPCAANSCRCCSGGAADGKREDHRGPRGRLDLPAAEGSWCWPAAAVSARCRSACCARSPAMAWCPTWSWARRWARSTAPTLPARRRRPHCAARGDLARCALQRGLPDRLAWRAGLDAPRLCGRSVRVAPPRRAAPAVPGHRKSGAAAAPRLTGLGEPQRAAELLPCCRLNPCPLLYRFFGRSVLATVGARLVGRPGGLGAWTFLGFFASLLPCFPLLIVVSSWWLGSRRSGMSRGVARGSCAVLPTFASALTNRMGSRGNRGHGSED